MKRHTQFTGIRNWYGGDLIDLQAEPLKVLDGFFTELGNFILCGCRITANGAAYNVSSGLVVLEGKGPNGENVKVVAPFDGAQNVALPMYLTLRCETQKATYEDGSLQPVAYIYKAVSTNVKPDLSHVEISTSSMIRFNDVVQDSMHRFLTDAERVLWNGKESTAGALAKANEALKIAKKYTDGALATLDVDQHSYKFDYIVDSDAALEGLRNNSRATSVLIRKGTWTASGSIQLHPNTKRIIGEVGSTLVFASAGSACLEYDANPQTDDYSVSHVTIRILRGTAVAGFNNMRNLHNCLVDIPKNAGIETYAFQGCANLTACEARLEDAGASGFHNCRSVSRCQVSGTSYCAFSACEQLKDCLDSSVGQYSYITCSGVFECSGNNNIFRCMRVMYCKAKAYAESYVSPQRQSAYACGNSHEGGWNITID